MKFIDRLKAAWKALRGEDSGPVNGGHKYAVCKGDVYVYADAVRINEWGLPEWFCIKKDMTIVYGRLTDSAIIYDYKPRITLQEFCAMDGLL